jgi:membrane associated rhomboid family serine protease
MTEPTTDAPAEGAPTCYRHPARETYVRCTRCDRPICPDCMTTASVGFQCPECVREGNKSVRQARTQFGGRVVAESNVTKVLVAINVVLFVGQLASTRVTDELDMWNAAVAFGGEYYRMVTSAFLHDPRILFHLLFNMYALVAFGGQMERLLGATRYLALYVVAALGGSVATFYFGQAELRSLGASGAVFGLFGAYFVLARSLRADTSQILVLIGINVAFGVVFHRYINNYAHGGGLVTGGLVAWCYTIGRKDPAGRNTRRTAIHLGAAAAIAVALLAATAYRVGELRDQYGPVRIVASSDAAVSPETPSR